MKKPSESFIPSFDSFPCFHRDMVPHDQQMIFLLSKKEFESCRSIQNHLVQNEHINSGKSLVSIQYSEQNVQVDKKKEEAIRTEDSLKGVVSRKKGGCVCKKTKCLKLYCQCFRKGQRCGINCSCCDCENVEQNKDFVEDARLLKKRRSKNSGERSYCNCKKSQCQKKYCQCFNSGYKCAMECRCQGCTNTSYHNH